MKGPGQAQREGARAVLVAGAPGAGKSTAGALIAAGLGAALLDLDTATGALMEVVSGLHGGADLDDAKLVRLTRSARYETLAALAEATLAVGTSVVLVAPFSTERRDPAAWEALCSRLARAGASTRLIWLRISAEEVHRRVGARSAARDAAKQDRDWVASLDLGPPVVPHLEVDALLPPERIAELVVSVP